MTTPTQCPICNTYSKESCVWDRLYGDGGVRCERRKFQNRIDELEVENKRLRAEKDEMVARNRLLRNRLDLPLERVTGYDEMIAKIDRLEVENKRLREALVECAIPLEALNISIERELCADMKKAITDAVKASRGALGD